MSYYVSSLNRIWVIAAVCAFRAYNGVPSLLSQKVTIPSSSPEMISPPWSRHRTIRCFGFPYVFPILLVNFSFPGLPISKIVIYPLISDTNNKFYVWLTFAPGLFFDSQKPSQLTLRLSPLMHVLLSVSTFTISSGLDGRQFRMNTIPFPLAMKRMLRCISCIIALSPPPFGHNP